MVPAVFLVAWLGSGNVPAVTQSTPAAVAPVRSIAVGWVDVNLDDWAALGYASRDDWKDVIEWNNRAFQALLRKKLQPADIIAADSGSEPKLDDRDLYIVFRDVLFDIETYELSLSIHFVRPDTRRDIAVVRRRAYRGGHFSVSNCLQGALEKVATEVSLRYPSRLQ